MLPDIKDLSPIIDLRQKTESLKYFYFIAAQGGLANDGDTFEARIKFNGRDDLIGKMNRLGFDINKKSEISEEELEHRKIKEFPDLVDPGRVILDEVKCLILVNKSISFYIHGTGTDNLYSFTMADFNACLRIEKIFDECGFFSSIDYTIENYSNCIFKKKNKYRHKIRLWPWRGKDVNFR